MKFALQSFTGAQNLTQSKPKRSRTTIVTDHTHSLIVSIQHGSKCHPIAVSGLCTILFKQCFCIGLA